MCTPFGGESFVRLCLKMNDNSEETVGVSEGLGTVVGFGTIS